MLHSVSGHAGQRQPRRALTPSSGCYNIRYMYECMYVCMYVCMYGCMYVYVCISLSLSLSTHIYIYIYIYTHIHVCVYIYIYVYAYIRTHRRAYVLCVVNPCGCTPLDLRASSLRRGCANLLRAAQILTDDLQRESTASLPVPFSRFFRTLSIPAPKELLAFPSSYSW